jgi:hypothetical protein
MLTELDVSGLKNISAVSLQQLLDTKLAQVMRHEISDLLNCFFSARFRMCKNSRLLLDFYAYLKINCGANLYSIPLSHDSRKFTQTTGNL